MKGCFGMEVNLSMYERLLRVVVGALLVSSVAFDRPFALTGWTVYAAAAAGAVLVATGITGNCPLYSFLDRMAEGAEKEAGKGKAASRASRKSSRASKAVKGRTAKKASRSGASRTSARSKAKTRKSGRKK